MPKTLTTKHLDYTHIPLPEDEELSITRSQLTQLMLESHRKSTSSAEEIMCLKEIGKINGLYDQKPTQVNISIEQHVQKLEVMSDEELLKLSGENQNLFALPPSAATNAAVPPSAATNAAVPRLEKEVEGTVIEGESNAV